MLVSGSWNAWASLPLALADDWSIVPAAAMASSQASGSPRTTTSKSDGATATSIARSASRNWSRFAGVAMMHDASAMPSWARSLAPSCISVTESLYRFGNTPNLAAPSLGTASYWAR
jgi:hypothetical protein